MATVKLENIYKSFDETEVLFDINLEINDKEFVVFVGPSGCGKTTLLRIISGLEEVTSGKVIIDDQDVSNAPPVERGISMVFQSYALYPHLSVFENIAFPLRVAKVNEKELKERVFKAADILQLNDRLDFKPGQLSGGQRQRVAIGRSIVRNPKVFLFDEPLSNLDAQLRGQVRIEIKKLQRSMNVTSVFVTHDQVEAMTLGDRLAVINNGIIEQIGTPLDLFETPATKFVATFIGSPSMNIISSTIEKDQGKYVMNTEDGISIPVPVSKQDTVKEGQKISFGFRAEDIVPLKFGNKPSQSWDYKSKVNLSEPLGTETLIFTNFGKIEIVSRMFTPELVRAGDELDFALNLDRTYLFDDETGKAL